MEKPIEPETQRRILELKFHSLDENQDQLLEKKEYRSLRKLARTTVTPRRCARTFIQRCDKNKDTKISKTEWLQCLGFDTQSKTRALFNLIHGKKLAVVSWYQISVW
jgi:Secreted protein acidic and rich in cysteine Ca binding region